MVRPSPRSVVPHVVAFCCRNAWLIVSLGILVGAGCSYHAFRHFSLNSNINGILSERLDWRQRELQFEHAFGRYQTIVAVVDAPTSELKDAAIAELVRALNDDAGKFERVGVPNEVEFFQKYGMLFEDSAALQQRLDGLVRAEPLIRDLSEDLSLRGLVAMLEDILIGVNSGRVALDALGPTFTLFSDTIDDVLAGRPSSFSWSALSQGKFVRDRAIGIIEVKPMLDYRSIEPGHLATQEIRKLAEEIIPRFQARVRLTGPVAVSDEEFGSIKENAWRNGLITGGIVLSVLWLALRSMRLVFAIIISTAVGLSATAAVGLAIVGSFNIISVYFAVLFVGIGVDFAIQFSVRYRAERFLISNLPSSVISAGNHVSFPLTLASLATAAAFFSFLPTDYRGLSELGLIAGCGMLIAFAASISLLPALIIVSNPKEEDAPAGYTVLAPVDEALARYRTPIIASTIAIVIAALPSLYWLKFDFDPTNLRNPRSESIATYRDLATDPANAVNGVEVLAPSLEKADEIAVTARAVPNVFRAMTLSSFLPEQQAEKIEKLRRAKASLEAVLKPADNAQEASDDENVAALREGAERLNDLGRHPDARSNAPAVRLASRLDLLAAAPTSVRKSAQATFIQPFVANLKSLDNALDVSPVTMSTLPESLRNNWITRDGLSRVSISPRGDLSGPDDLRRFAIDVLTVIPNATEGPISIYEAGRTVVLVAPQLVV